MMRAKIESIPLVRMSLPDAKPDAEVPSLSSGLQMGPISTSDHDVKALGSKTEPRHSCHALLPAG